MKSSKGFTLTEILIILVVIVILAAIAIPKYYSVRDKDMQDKASHFANDIATDSTLNYMECKTGNSAVCKKTLSCSDFAALLPNKLPKGMYVILKPGTPFPAEAGQMVECQVIYGSQPADFKAIANP